MFIFLYLIFQVFTECIYVQPTLKYYSDLKELSYHYITFCYQNVDANIANWYFDVPVKQYGPASIFVEIREDDKLIHQGYSHEYPCKIKTFLSPNALYEVTLAFDEIIFEITGSFWFTTVTYRKVYKILIISLGITFTTLCLIVSFIILVIFCAMKKKKSYHNLVEVELVDDS